MTAEEIAHSILVEVTATLDQYCSQWNQSDEAEALGLQFGYATLPIIEITATPKDDSETRLLRGYLEVREA